MGSKVTENYRALSRQLILDKAYDLGWNFDLFSGSCSQCTVAALQELLGFEDILVKAATSSCGGQALQLMGTCGALVGGTMVLDYYFGRPLSDMSYQQAADRDKLFSATRIAKLLYDEFMKKYGAVSCANIQRKLFGRLYWVTDPDEAAKFEAAGAHIDPDKCMDVVGDAARWTMEILLDKRAILL
jgi:C_GCAxxG_C_C family probable redox protein